MCDGRQGNANGKPHWASVDSTAHDGIGTQHLYYAPNGKRQWLLRNKFTPDEPTCSGYHEGDDLRAGPSDWQWADSSAWKKSSLIVTQYDHPGEALREEKEPQQQKTSPPAGVPAKRTMDPIEARFERADKIKEGMRANQANQANQVRPIHVGRCLSYPLRNWVHPPGEDPAPANGYAIEWQKGNPSMQLGPYLSGQFESGMKAGEALVRAPPYPFVDAGDPTAAGGFGVLSRSVVGLDFINLPGRTDQDSVPLAEIVCEIKLETALNPPDMSDEENEDSAHVLRKTVRQIADLNVAIQASGEPNALVLRDLDVVCHGPFSTIAKDIIVGPMQQMLRDCVAAIVKEFPTAPELYAFLGWGPNGEGEVGTLEDLKQRRLDLYKALSVARNCEIEATRRYFEAFAAARAAEDPKERQKLTRLKMSELRKRASACGFSEDKLAEFYDLDEPKAAIVDAIVKTWVQEPESKNRLFIKQPFRPLAFLVTGSRVAAVNGVYVQAGTYGSKDTPFGSRESFPHYNNGDRMMLTWVDSDRRDLEPFCTWRFQRTPGVRNTTAFCKWEGHKEAKYGLPIGIKRWWFYKPNPNEPADSYIKDTERYEAAGVPKITSRWRYRRIEIIPLRDDAAEHPTAAALFPDAFRLPVGCQVELPPKPPPDEASSDGEDDPDSDPDDDITPPVQHDPMGRIFPPPPESEPEPELEPEPEPEAVAAKPSSSEPATVQRTWEETQKFLTPSLCREGPWDIPVRFSLHHAPDNIYKAQYRGALIPPDTLATKLCYIEAAELTVEEVRFCSEFLASFHFFLASAHFLLDFP